MPAGNVGLSANGMAAARRWGLARRLPVRCYSAAHTGGLFAAFFCDSSQGLPMAAGSLLALLDDIATILDDVALMTKVAAKKSAAMADDVSVMTKVAAQKTAGVLGDDLALNAQQVTGVRAEREVPVVLAVAKGSLINKVILVPAALLISAFAPWAITPILMLGASYLCFEGAEKIVEALRHEDHADELDELALSSAELEKEKVGGAIRTDFILSAEIIVIALGTVANAPFSQQVAVLASIAVAMTVGVYGLVAAIVKMDDAGLYRQVLLRFRKDYQAAVAQMRQLLADGEREAAQRKAHSMKGAAGMIGAEELQHVAGVTEAALSAANAANNAATGAAASADDEASLATLQTALDQLLRAIAAHVDGNASAGNAAGSSATGPGAAKTAVETAAAPALHAEAHALTARLAKLLNDGNGEAIDVLE
eukprot:gene30712-34661_t